MSESDQNGQLAKLVRNQIPSLMRFAVRLTGDLHSAEDVVQESLLRAARSASGFEGRASIRTWLTQIMINVYRTQRAAARKTEEFDESQHLKPTASSEQLLESQETQEQLRELIQQLPDRQREVLILTAWEDYSVPEVAELLGITAQNVYSNLSAARARLKQSLNLGG